jgi:hypothetical protein
MAKFDLKKAILENKATFFSSLTEGQFSWMTQDTGEQIGSQDENQIPVYMFDDKGKYYYENDYDGYGVFGGKDYYDLVAEMNGYTADNAEEFGGMFNDLRGIGIKLAFGELETKNENGDILFPALVTRPNFNWKSHDFTQESKNDPNQSWYEPEKDDEDDDYGSDNDDDYDDSRDVDDDEYGDMAEGYMGQFYAPEYLEQKYGKEMASKITAEIEEMDENSYDRFTGMESAEEVDEYVSDIVSMLNENKKYYKDAEADDAEHIKALEKDMKDDKKSSKMKKSELKDKIKEMILKEMESNNMEDAPENEVDFLAELEGMLSEEDGLTPLQDYVYQYEIEISGEDEAQEFLDDIKKLNTPDDVYDYYAYDRDWSGSDLNNIFRQVSKKFKNVSEAKDEEVADEEVEVTDDFSMEEPQGPGGIDVTQNANADLTGTKKDVQDNLEAALEAARALGDEKLATQVGNTITFFNKQHVVKDTPIAENLNEALGLVSLITILIASILLNPISGPLLMGLFKYLFQDLPEQRAKAKELKTYNGPDKKEQVLALAKEIESQLSPGKKKYLTSLVNAIGKSKLEDEAKAYQELDSYAKREKNLMARELNENINVDLENALEDLPIPMDMEEDEKSSINESMFPMLKKILK